MGAQPPDHRTGGERRKLNKENKRHRKRQLKANIPQHVWIKGEKREGRIGVWVRRPDKGPLVEDKIAAIGVRVSRWVSFHGISLNVAPDLGHYDGIVPCGISQHGVTSLEDLGHIVSMEEVDGVLKSNFERHFGAVRVASAL